MKTFHNFKIEPEAEWDCSRFTSLPLVDFIQFSSY